MIGSYEPLNEQPMAAAGDAHFICFTDDPQLRSDSWELRLVTPRLPADPVRSSRWVKCSPHELLPRHGTSLYIDNTVILRQPATVLLAELLDADASFGCVRHSYRDDIRGEADAVKEADLDAWYVVDEQLAHYEISDPASLAAPALWSGIMARRHHDPTVVRAMTLWWEHICRYSRRDQLSIQTCLRAAGLTPKVVRHDLFDSSFWNWPVHESRAGRPHSLAGGPIEVIAALRRTLESHAGAAAPGPAGA